MPREDFEQEEKTANQQHIEDLRQQEDEDFDSLFDEFTGGNVEGEDDEDDNAPDGDTGREDEPADEGEGEAGKPEGEDQSDPYEGLDEKAIERIKKLEAERDQYAHRAASDSGRIAAYQRQVNELQSQLTGAAKQAKEEGSDEAPTKQQMAEALESPEQWEEFKEAFPEIADAMEARLKVIDQQAERAAQRVIEQRLSEVDQRIKPIEESYGREVIAEQVAALDAAHPDWRDIYQSNGFHEWLDRQPEPVRRLNESDAAEDAAYLISSYKAMATMRTPGGSKESADERAARIERERRERLESNVQVKGRAPRPSATDQGDGDDFDAMFKQFAKRKDKR